MEMPRPPFSRVSSKEASHSGTHANPRPKATPTFSIFSTSIQWSQPGHDLLNFTTKAIHFVGVLCVLDSDWRTDDVVNDDVMRDRVIPMLLMEITHRTVSVVTQWSRTSFFYRFCMGCTYIVFGPKAILFGLLTCCVLTNDARSSWRCVATPRFAHVSSPH